MEFVAAPSPSRASEVAGKAAPRPPSSAARRSSLSMITPMSTSPLGLQHSDHHTRDSSPPAKLSTLYDFLPKGDDVKRLPPRIILVANVTEMSIQSQCFGVYELVPFNLGTDLKPTPVWKHTLENLAIVWGPHREEECWLVARFTSLGKTGADNDDVQNVCMRLAAGRDEMPFGRWSDGQWQAWIGRRFEVVPSVKCRPTYHGWGTTGVGNITNPKASVRNALHDARLRKLSIPSAKELYSNLYLKPEVAGSPTSIIPPSSLPSSKADAPRGYRDFLA